MEAFDYFLAGTVIVAFFALAWACFIAGRVFQHEKEKDKPGEL
jgi:hypothetical protein